MNQPLKCAVRYATCQSIVKEHNRPYFDNILFNNDQDDDSVTVDAEFTLNEGVTPLMLACIGGSFPVIRRLLIHGGDLEMKDEENWSCLVWAWAESKSEVEDTCSCVVDYRSYTPSYGSMSSANI